MTFELLQTDTCSKARAGLITTDHGQIETPIFMPVGTVGSVKGVTVRDLKDAIHLLEACKESILNVYEKRMKITREQASSLMTKTTWMDAQQALEDGFIDGILSVRQAGPTDCIIPVADAEKKVQAWIDRHKISASMRISSVTMKDGVLFEALKLETPALDDQENTRSSPDNDTLNDNDNVAQSDTGPDENTNEHGTPVSQLQKRLALIMPTEAKNKEKNTHE